MTFFFQRVLWTLPILFGVLTLVFFLIHMIPGDRVDMSLGGQGLAVAGGMLRARVGSRPGLGRRWPSCHRCTTGPPASIRRPGGGAQAPTTAMAWSSTSISGRARPATVMSALAG